MLHTVRTARSALRSRWLGAERRYVRAIAPVPFGPAVGEAAAASDSASAKDCEKGHRAGRRRLVEFRGFARCAGPRGIGHGLGPHEPRMSPIHASQGRPPPALRRPPARRRGTRLDLFWRRGFKAKGRSGWRISTVLPYPRFNSSQHSLQEKKETSSSRTLPVGSSAKDQVRGPCMRSRPCSCRRRRDTSESDIVRSVRRRGSGRGSMMIARGKRSRVPFRPGQFRGGGPAPGERPTSAINSSRFGHPAGPHIRARRDQGEARRSPRTEKIGPRNSQILGCPRTADPLTGQGDPVAVPRRRIPRPKNREAARGLGTSSA